jgi:hypothetical protein
MKTKRDTSGSDALKAFVEEAGKLVGKVGWFESAQYPDGTPVALVAMVQEYGSASNGIPPHPYFRQAIAENRARWDGAAAQLIRDALASGGGAGPVFEALTLIAQGDVHKKISELGNYAADAPVIKARRGRKNPPPNQSTAILRDTLTMFNTLTSVVESK